MGAARCRTSGISDFIASWTAGIAVAGAGVGADPPNRTPVASPSVPTAANSRLMMCPFVVGSGDSIVPASRRKFQVSSSKLHAESRAQVTDEWRQPFCLPPGAWNTQLAPSLAGRHSRNRYNSHFHNPAELCSLADQLPTDARHFNA